MCLRRQKYDKISTTHSDTASPDPKKVLRFYFLNPTNVFLISLRPSQKSYPNCKVSLWYDYMNTAMQSINKKTNKQLSMDRRDILIISFLSSDLWKFRCPQRIFQRAKLSSFLILANTAETKCTASHSGIITTTMIYYTDAYYSRQINK